MFERERKKPSESSGMCVCDQNEIIFVLMQTNALELLHSRPHDTIHTPFWGLAGITGVNGSSWN